MMSFSTLARGSAVALLMSAATGANAAAVNVADALVNDASGVCPDANKCTVDGGTVTGAFDLSTSESFSVNSLAASKSIVLSKLNEDITATFNFDYTGRIDTFDEEDAFFSAVLSLTLGGVDLNDSGVVYSVDFDNASVVGKSFSGIFTITNETNFTEDLVFDDFHLTGLDFEGIVDGPGGIGGGPGEPAGITWASTTFQPASVIAPQGPPAGVPEPATLLVLGAGLLGLGAVRRRARG